MAWNIHTGDVVTWLRTLPADHVHCWITSPPYYGLRDYGVEGQIGLEDTPAEYIAKMVQVFRELKRTLHPRGTVWLNMGDGYAGKPNGPNIGQSTLDGSLAPHVRHRLSHALRKKKLHAGFKHKDLLGMPWRLALALQDDGWTLRLDIIWNKPNAMPESAQDRPRKSHEYIFMLVKSRRYFYDQDAVRKPQKSKGKKHEGKSGYKKGHPSKRHGYTNMQRILHPDGSALGSVWTISVARTKDAHFATFPKKLVEPCVLAGTSQRGCCPVCRAPWKRIVEKTRVPTRPGTSSKLPAGWDTKSGRHGKIHREGRNGVLFNKHGQALQKGNPRTSQNGDVYGNRDPQRHCTVRKTAGWKPGCDCEEAVNPIPCLVGDPFAGSGTTLLVATELGRDAIGCELNPEYVRIIERRMRVVTPAMF